eukprot:scaffold11378_cov112-Cylindrotheca_fusiformis.AAC.1
MRRREQKRRRRLARKREKRHRPKKCDMAMNLDTSINQQMNAWRLQFVKKREYMRYHNRSAAIDSAAFSINSSSFWLLCGANLIHLDLPKE